MPKEIIHTPDVPGSPYFSQAVKAGPFIYLSGITGTNPETKQLAGPTIQDQVRQSLENCRAVLQAADSGLDGVVEVHILLARPEDFAGFNAVYAEFFPTEPPARSVSRLGVEVPNLLVSIRMTAYVGT